MSDPKQMSLKQRALRAGAWSIGGYGLSQVIRVGSNLVMARLLVPEMFGIVAVATTVMVILSMLSDVGLRQNIVQSRRGDDPAFLDTVWVIQIVRGGVLWLGAFLLSLGLHLANLGGLLPAKSVYASPILPLVIAVSAISSIISGFQSTKMAVADRRFNQKRLVQIELISQCVGLITMIVTSVISRSIWVLVAGGLVVSLTMTVLSHTWISGPSNRFRLEKSALRELINFGKWIFLSSFVGVLATQGDRLIVGGFVDANIMGLFAIVFLILRAIANGLYRLFVAVCLPALSECARKEPSRLHVVYYKLSIPSDLLLLFTSGFLFSAGQLVIDLLYDDRYSPAGDILRVLALSLFMVRYGVAEQIYFAVARPHYLTVINVVRFMALYGLVPPLYYVGGTEALIWGLSLHALATVPFIYYFNARLGLIDLRREALVLLALPVGYLSGGALNLVVTLLLSG